MIRREYILSYIWSVFWVFMVLCFSYGDLLLNLCKTNGVDLNIKFAAKLYDMHKGYDMMLTDMGLVVLLFLDKFICHKMNKREYSVRTIDILLLLNILLAALLTIFAGKMNEAESGILPYLFMIFVVILVVYKAESIIASLKRVYYASNILQSKKI